MNVSRKTATTPKAITGNAILTGKVMFAMKTFHRHLQVPPFDLPT